MRYVSPFGIISTVVGTGGCAVSGDGPATSSTLNNPSIGTDDGLGGWLISDASSNMVRLSGTSGSATRSLLHLFPLWQIRRMTLATGSQTPSPSPTASQTPSQSPTATFTAARQWMISLFAGNYAGGYAGDGGAWNSSFYARRAHC